MTTLNIPSVVEFENALERVRQLSPKARAQLESTIALSPARALWSPLPGPQQAASEQPITTA